MQHKPTLAAIVLLLFSFMASAQSINPYTDTDKKQETVTLTKGEYEEVFDEDSIQRIGSAFVDVNTMKVVDIHLTKEEQGQLDNGREGRFLSVDPLTSGFPMLTPYQYASNTPIQAIDLDGLEGIVGSPLGSQNIISVPTAKKVNEELTVHVFKTVFTEALPKKLIEHYAHGHGEPYHLSQAEMTQLHTKSTGINGIVQKDNEKFQNLIKGANAGDKIELPEGYGIQGAAGTGGTLGRFRIELKGEIIIDKKDKTKWTFSGQMKFTDIFDFKTSPVTDADLNRSTWGDAQTAFASKYLPGTGFNVTSDWVNIKQTSSDQSFDWFQGKPKFEDGKQNEISGEMKNHPGISNETINKAKSDVKN